MRGQIRTERLLVRRWTDQDLGPFADMNADAEVMEHFPAPLDRAGSDALAARADAHLAERGWGLWALEVTAGEGRGRFAGFTDLRLEEVVSFTAVSNTRSQAVMRRIGMTRDPDGDFHHPTIPRSDPKGRSVLYRLGAARWRAGLTGCTDR